MMYETTTIMQAMEKAIKMSWYSQYCALCVAYNIGGFCPRCALKKTGNGSCGLNWALVNDSLTWGTWYKNSGAMLKQLKDALPKRRD